MHLLFFYSPLPHVRHAQFASVDTLLGTMKKLPTQVFMVADLTAEEKKLVNERGELSARCTLPCAYAPDGSEITRASSLRDANDDH
jgi:chemotaxis response regulator CheB